jgi:2,4-dienoyl-CoA reductase-like NADH-dependent reductase (Old Yellow Enzyme family)/thioredoxin reductase
MASPFRLLFTPIRLGPAEAKNRIVSTSHDAHFGEQGYPTDRYIRYHVEKAKGGAGLVQAFGTASVHPSSSGGAGNINLHDDAVIPHFRRMAAQIHQHGAIVTCQLVHRGRRMSTLASRRPTVGPFAAPNERTGEIPHELSRTEIHDIVDAYAAAALRVCRGEFDGVELAFFGDMLPDEFLSPVVNRRRDEYGGSLENRLRFSCEIVRAVREAVGRGFVVGARLSADDFQEGEPGRPDRLEVARILDSLGALDYFSVTAGTVKGLAGRARHVPSSYFPHGVYLDLVAPYKQSVRVPVIYAGRIVHPAEAEDVLRRGTADLVGMTRAIIADPEMPRKAQAGRLEDIRVCVGANEGCIGRLYMGLSIECVQNPAVGREAELAAIHPAVRRKRTLVVGGGPAGLEAARVAALRGHEVVLVEQDGELGGQVRAAGRAPGRGEFLGIAGWLVRQIEKAGVEIVLQTDATPELVRAHRPDVVVVATGSRPRFPSIPIAGDAFVVSARDVLLDRATPRGRVAIIADDPHMTGPTTADFLAARGYSVEVITPHYVVGEGIDDTQKPVILERLLRQGVALSPLLEARAILSEGVQVRHILTGETRVIPSDTVVAACGGCADDALFHALRDWPVERYLIGDAFAPRRVHDALLEGTRVARGL